MCPRPPGTPPEPDPLDDAPAADAPAADVQTENTTTANASQDETQPDDGTTDARSRPERKECAPSPRLLPRRPPVPTHPVAFETGNPSTGAAVAGTLHLDPHSPDSTLFLLQSVPGLMTQPDLCKFVAPHAESIRHIRAIRQASEPNRYLAVILFADAAAARAFAQAVTAKPYLRGLVPDTVELRSVRSITFSEPPPQAHTPKLAKHSSRTGRNSRRNPAFSSSSSPSSAAAVVSTTGARRFPRAQMFPDDVERDLPQPLCPVCLERQDGTSALFTTFCNHTMHASCLSRWDLNTCPVCRYTHELKPEATVCMRCNQGEDLWMCVVCAFVGCGFYKHKHAQAHFKESQHPFALNLKDMTFWSGETLTAGTVWDYVSERFVNRLATSDDGKIVEVDARANPFPPDGAAASSGTAMHEAEASCCASTSRHVVDEDDEDNRRLQAAVQASRVQATVDEYRRRMAAVEAEQAAERARYEQQLASMRENLAAAAKEKKALQKRVTDSEKELKSLGDKNGFLKSLNETLLRDKQGWNDEVERLKTQVKEANSMREGLEEQLRDVMMHLEAQAKISGAGESCRSDASELHGGDVVRVGPSARQRLAMKTNRRYSGT